MTSAVPQRWMGIHALLCQAAQHLCHLQGASAHITGGLLEHHPATHSTLHGLQRGTFFAKEVPLLTNFVNLRAKLKALLENGSISSLTPEMAPKN